MEKDFINDVPLSESHVSLKLSEIQKRCTELLDDSAELELALEDQAAATETPSEPSYDPYDRG